MEFVIGVGGFFGVLLLAALLLAMLNSNSPY